MELYFCSKCEKSLRFAKWMWKWVHLVARVKQVVAFACPLTDMMPFLLVAKAHNHGNDLTRTKKAMKKC